MGLGIDKKGQFIVIAAMLMSIMIISISAIIYSSVTYFKAERWEEYVILVDSVKTGTTRVVEISLANYTQTLNTTILRDNMDKWSPDVKQAYPGFGVILTYTLPSALTQAYGVSINYALGLARTWYQATSFSAGNTNVSLSLASAGLTGYSFSTSAFLKETILDATYTAKTKMLTIYLSIEREDLIPITNLKKDSFSLRVDGVSKDFSVSRYYSSTFSRFIYEIRRENEPSLPFVVSVTATETRGIRVIANSTVMQV